MSKKGYLKTKFNTETVIYTKLINFPPINPFNKRYSFFIKLATKYNVNPTNSPDTSYLP